MNDKLTKPYDPAATERRIYDTWEKSGVFNPETAIKNSYTKADATPFTIVMPPPNVTGALHMGHALMLTLEDIIIRYKRMRGYRTLWLPGTDHAAIATQAKVEKELSKKEGQSRHDLGRAEFLKRVEAFATASHDQIIAQIKVMGASCDWSREAFTFDDERNLAVRTLFKQMYDHGLIYRGHRIVNWDPKGQTTISDDEIVYQEREGKLYTFRYSKDFPFTISTTRPETKLGDTAVAVHPEDTRYQKYIGQEFDLEFCGTPIHLKVVADEAVDKDFGTGALGVTPAHSLIDAEIATRHNLPSKQVIDERAKIMNASEALNGKKVAEAREIIVAWLQAQGLLEKEEAVKQNVATAERTGGIIEPLPKLQWFVAVNKEIPGRGKTLKDLMREPLESGEIKIVPDYFTKTYFHWIDNLRDWCISRQIWYGHQVPVYYRSTGAHSESEIYCGIEPPEGENWTQDPDTLDTWFSSGSWTFSTLGWPNQTVDLKTYHPTDILETGYDILFFWIARMILMTGYALQTIPFKTVYLHGLVRDGDGAKMSKSLGNSLDPIEVAGEFGADASRMALVVSTAPGTDSRISKDKIKGYKHFSNKLWNISRFTLDTPEPISNTKPNNLTEADEKRLAELNDLVTAVTADFENYRYHLASERLYHYVWHTLADEIIEEAKPRRKADDKVDTAAINWLLQHILETCLILLHPFMPFITEEIWSFLPERSTPLIATPWPNQII